MLVVQLVEGLKTVERLAADGGRHAGRVVDIEDRIAGSWLIASVCMLRMKHISSTILAFHGSSSLTHMPQLPCWANLYFDGAMGKRACFGQT